MKTIDIKGTSREDLGKKATKALRAEGNVPCVIYGKDGVTHFYVKSSDVKDLIYTPNVYIIDVAVGDKTAKSCPTGHSISPCNGMKFFTLISYKFQKKVL